jgi:hypothetical protein
MADQKIRFGPVDASLSQAQVVHLLEQTIEIWFLESAGGQLAAAEEFARFVLTVDREAESAFELACPYVLDVIPEGVRPGSMLGVAVLGSVFGRVVSSGQFLAVMMVDDRELAATRGVPVDL